MSEGTIIRDLTTGNPMKQLLKFSFPFIMANLLQQAYNIVDMIIVGHFVGSAGLAAASFGGELAMMFLFGVMGLASGGQVVISQHIGAGHREEVGKTIGTLFTFVMLAAVVFMTAALIFCDDMLRALNVPEEAMQYAHDYSIVYFSGMLTVSGYNVVSSVLRGMGDSKHPFMFIALSACLNVVLDLLFVGPLNMACKGAALATVLSQAVSFVVAMIFLYRHRAEFHFDFRLSSFRIEKKELSGIFRIGLPLGVMNIAVSITMLIIMRFVNAYGVDAAAASAVGNKITMLATICTGALMTAGNSVVAQNFAARKFKRVTTVVLCILAISLAFCGLLSLILALFPEQVFSIFDDNPAVLALSHDYVVPGVIALIGFATRGTGFAFCNGIGNSRLTFWGGLIDGIVARLGLGWLFGIQMGMGVQGFWLGNGIAGNIIGIAAALYYIFGKWKDRELLVA